MSEIHASVILAEKIDDDSIIKIINTLPSNKKNTIWMYLTVKTNITEDEEIHICFDIVKLDDENGFGIELGEFVVGKTADELKQKEILSRMKESAINAELIREEGKSILPYKEIFKIGQKFPPLPELDPGYYEFVVYVKQENENYVLDTFQFNVK